MIDTILIHKDDSHLRRTESGLFKAKKEGSLYLSRPQQGIVYKTVGRYKSGDTIWFHHHATDDEILIGIETFYKAQLHHVLAKGNIDSLEPSEGVIVALQDKRPPKEVNGILLESKEQDVGQQSIVLFSGSKLTKKGDKIRYKQNADYEIEYKDRIYYFIHERFLFEVNGDIVEGRVEVEPLDEEDSFEENEVGLFVMKKDRTPKGYGKVVRTSTNQVRLGETVIFKRNKDQLDGNFFVTLENLFATVGTDK